MPYAWCPVSFCNWRSTPKIQSGLTRAFNRSRPASRLKNGRVFMQGAQVRQKTAPPAPLQPSWRGNFKINHTAFSSTSKLLLFIMHLYCHAGPDRIYPKLAEGKRHLLHCSKLFQKPIYFKNMVASEAIREILLILLSEVNFFKTSCALLSCAGLEEEQLHVVRRHN